MGGRNGGIDGNETTKSDLVWLILLIITIKVIDCILNGKFPTITQARLNIIRHDIIRCARENCVREGVYRPYGGTLRPSKQEYELEQ